MGGILVMLVLYFFFKDFWVIVIILVFILVLVIVIFNLMYVNDISLNMMSLGGIVLVVGLLVDNSIVVFENIDCYKKLKMVGSDNVIVNEKMMVEVIDIDVFVVSEGIKEVFGVIVVLMLIIMVVFVLLIFVEGIVG